MSDPQPPISPPPGRHARPRRPPLAEVDAAVLVGAVRARQWAVVAPWGALLAGFSLVLAGMICFFWLSALVSGHPEDRWLIVPLAGGLGVFVWQRFGTAPGFAATLLLVLGAITAGATLLWLALFAAVGQEVWASLGGVLVVCFAGIAVGLWGLNRLGPPPDANPQPSTSNSQPPTPSP